MNIKSLKRSVLRNRVKHLLNSYKGLLFIHSNYMDTDELQQLRLVCNELGVGNQVYYSRNNILRESLIEDLGLSKVTSKNLSRVLSGPGLVILGDVLVGLVQLYEKLKKVSQSLMLLGGVFESKYFFSKDVFSNLRRYHSDDAVRGETINLLNEVSFGRLHSSTQVSLYSLCSILDRIHRG